MSIYAWRAGMEVEVYQHEDGRWRIDVKGMPALPQEFGKTLAELVADRCEQLKRLGSIVVRLDKRVDELELSVRSANALHATHIVYVGELVKKSEEKLLKTRNFGRKSIREIKENLFDMGLSLDMDVGDLVRPDQRPTTPPTA